MFYSDQNTAVDIKGTIQPFTEMYKISWTKLGFLGKIYENHINFANFHRFLEKISDLIFIKI